MNLFIHCDNCEFPVITTNRNPFCPFCKKALKNLDEGHRGEFGFFIEDYKEKEYFEWEDIQKLIYAVDYLTEINNKTCIDLGTALIELSKAKDRIEWYRRSIIREL